MTRNEAIDWLKAISFVSDPHITEALDMAIESLSDEAKTKCIAQITVDVDEIVERIKEEYGITNGWIPVSDRLPEEEEKTYWVCTDAEYQCECRWTNTNHFWTHLTTDWHWHIMDIPKYTKVIAWMPLPEPYKAESEEV